MRMIFFLDRRGIGYGEYFTIRLRAWRRFGCLWKLISLAQSEIRCVADVQRAVKAAKDIGERPFDDDAIVEVEKEMPFDSRLARFQRANRSLRTTIRLDVGWPAMSEPAARR